MTTNQQDGITLINIFTVTPKKQHIAADKVAHIYKTRFYNTTLSLCWVPQSLHPTYNQAISTTLIINW